MNNLKNVIFFVTSLQSGGLENYLLRFLQEKHHEFGRIMVYCKGGIGGQLEQQYQSISNVEIVKNKISFYNSLHYLKLKRFLKENNFDAICDFTGNFAGMVLSTAKKAGIKKRIAFYRGSSDHFKAGILKNTYNNWVNKLVYKKATDILSNSQAAFDYFFSGIWNQDKRFDVIYNGINARSFLMEKESLREDFKIPYDAFVVGHTGRFNSAKNHSTILKVASELIEKNKDFYFILCGNQVKNSLEPFLKEKALSDRILVFENRSDIPKFLNTMNCYYFPSITEGQPNALIEAMLMDIPIVASNIEPIKETVPETIYPFLVDPLDVEGAKNKILEIYNSNISQNLQEWTIKKYDSKQLFQQFYNHF